MKLEDNILQNKRKKLKVKIKQETLTKLDKKKHKNWRYNSKDSKMIYLKSMRMRKFKLKKSILVKIIMKNNKRKVQKFNKQEVALVEMQLTLNYLQVLKNDNSLLIYQWQSIMMMQVRNLKKLSQKVVIF